MIAVFYDRKNNRNVTNVELVRTKLIQEIAVVDSDDDFAPTGRRINPYSGECLSKTDFDFSLANGYLAYAADFHKSELKSIPDEDYYDFSKWKEEKTPIVVYPTEQLLADLAYKSDKCPSYCNHDVHTTITDLVFLYLEDEKDAS